MSGHSHFSSIKHKKALTDAKRGKIFSKLARIITVTAKEKGGDPEMNSSLKLAIEKAKGFNMPKDNIERAIKRGIGEIDGVKFENVLFEAYGQGKIAIIIEGVTDNKNRALAEIKQILNQYNGKLAGEGSVKWMFERKGTLEIQSEKDKEELELLAIEAGAEDFLWDNNIMIIYTKPEELEKVRKNLESQEIKFERVSLDWVAKEEIKADEKEEKNAQKLFEALDESETVQEIYSNLNY